MAAGLVQNDRAVLAKAVETAQEEQKKEAANGETSWWIAKFDQLQPLGDLAKLGQDNIDAASDVKELRKATEELKGLVNDFLAEHSNCIKRARMTAKTLVSHATQAQKRCTALASKVEKARARLHESSAHDAAALAAKRRKVTPTVPEVFQRRWEGTCKCTTFTEVEWKAAAEAGQLNLDQPFKVVTVALMKELASEAEVAQKLLQFSSDCSGRPEVMAQGRGQRILKKQEVRDALAELVPTKAQLHGTCRLVLNFAVPEVLPGLVGLGVSRAGCRVVNTCPKNVWS